jgi:hypothetical protein
MKNGFDPKAIDRLFQPAGAEEGENFGILSGHGRADRRIMQQRDPSIGLQFAERLLEAQRLVDCLLHELFDQRFAPGIEHSPAETAAKTADAGESDAADFDRFAIEDCHSSGLHDLTHQLRFT